MRAVFYLLITLHSSLFTLTPKVSAAGISGRAIKNDNAVRVKKDIKRGARVNDKDWFGRTPLMKSVRSGSVKVTTLLLESGADIDTQDKNGWTALMWAAFDNSWKTGKILLDRGADIDIKEKLGFNALMLAKSRNSKKMLKLLKEAQRKIKDERLKIKDTTFGGIKDER